MTSSTLSFSTCPISCLPHRYYRRAQARRAAHIDILPQRALHLGAAASSSIAGFEAVGPAGIAVLRRDVCSANTGSANRTRQVTRMGNKSGTGPFTPLVIVARNILGKKDFNQLRGKAISLHSQVIKNFGSQIGADGKQVQGLIRLAKKNGEKLGFLS